VVSLSRYITKELFYLTHIKAGFGDSRHACAMTRIYAPFLLTCMLALSLASGAVTAGRAAGLAAFKATLTQMVICAGSEGEKTVHLARDGTPVDLPHCEKIMCDHCLQTGSHAVVTAPFQLDAPRVTGAGQVDPGADLHHPEIILIAQIRAPPAAKATA